jgi:hypothetical protein
MHLVDRHVVNGGLGFGNPHEQLAGPRLPRRGQGRAFDVARDVAQAVVRTVFVMVVMMAVVVAMVVIVCLTMRVPLRAIVTVVVVIAVIVGAIVLVLVIVLAMLLVLASRRNRRLVVRQSGTGGLRGGFDQTELSGRDAGAEHALGGDGSVVDRQTAERLAQRRDRQPEIEQGAEDHVARCAGKAVEIQRLAQSVPFSR